MTTIFRHRGTPNVHNDPRRNFDQDLKLDLAWGAEQLMELRRRLSGTLELITAQGQVYACSGEQMWHSKDWGHWERTSWTPVASSCRTRLPEFDETRRDELTGESPQADTEGYAEALTNALRTHVEAALLQQLYYAPLQPTLPCVRPGLQRVKKKGTKKKGGLTKSDWWRALQYELGLALARPHWRAQARRSGAGHGPEASVLDSAPPAQLYLMADGLRGFMRWHIDVRASLHATLGPGELGRCSVAELKLARLNVKAKHLNLVTL